MSSGPSIVPGGNFDPNMVVKLAMRPKDHDPDTFATVMSTLMSSSSSIYDRGLAAWAIGRLLQLQSKHDKYYLKKQILDQSGVIMDALVDIIGASKDLGKKAAAAAAAGSVSSHSIASSSAAASHSSLIISPKRAKKLISSSPSSVSILDLASTAGSQPSVNDCNNISKNCSLIIVMLSNFLADIDGDPYTFQPPPTPLHRMAATPEVMVNSDDDVNGTKKTMKKKRRKHRQTATTKALEDTKNGDGNAENDQSDGDLDKFLALNNQDAEEVASEVSESPKGKGERKYFRKTNMKAPDLLLSEYMASPQIPPSELGDDPRPRKTMNPNSIAGELTMPDGSKMITLSRREGGPQPRTSVLFDDQPAWDVPVAAAATGDFLAKDSKLGYQVPRLYLGQDRPHTSNHIPTMPSPRGSPTNKALRPKTSEDIRREYHSIEAKYMLEEIRKMTPSETGWYSLPPDEEWQAMAFPEGQQPVWTPSKGVNPDKLPKAWSTMNFNSTTRKSMKLQQLKTNIVDKEQSEPTLEEIKIESSSGRKEKTLLRQKLAGDSQSYESRQIQRARDMMSASTNFAFFPPTAESPPMTAAIAEPKWGFEDDQEEEEDEVEMSVRFSPQSRGVSRARTSSPSKPRPVSPYQIDDILAATPQYLPGTMVELDDYRRLQLTTAESKMANKRATLASREAKEEYRRRRLKAIVSADDKDLPPEELSKLARNDHRSILSILTNQRNTLDTHALSLKNKIEANMQVQNKALPLRFLFTVEGGAEICRSRLRDCFRLWIHGFECAQKTVALAMWKMLVDAQVRKEKHVIYRSQAGRRKLKVIINEIDLRLYKRTLDRWSKTVSYLIYVERDRAATKIQAQIYRYQAAVKFVELHDSCPIGGPLSDIYLEPTRKSVKFMIHPRVRTEKRQFWAGALAIQTRYRMVVIRTHFILMKLSSVMIQSIWRMWVERKEYMRLRYHAILIESMARMVVKKWKYKRLLKSARVAQRIFRGYRAKLRFFILLKKYRVEIERRLSMPPRIQRAWRIKVAKRRVQALRDDKEELYNAAVRLQCFWYKHQGEFPRFVLLGVLRETDKLEQEFEKQIKRYGKEALARKIQRYYRQHLWMRHEKGAVRIQCMARNFAGTNLVDRLRLEKWANRKLRCWARVMMKKRNKASSRIAFAFWRGKKGRFLDHLKTMNDRMEKEERWERRKKLNYHASILQAVVHGVWTRRIIKRTLETIKIQRVGRGFLGRRKALARLRSIQTAVASAFIFRMSHEAEIKEVYRVKKVKKQSAINIGRCWRGYMVRDRFWREKEYRRVRDEAATVLQRKYRKMLQVKRARSKILQMQRKLTNPFREYISITSLVKECMKRSDLKYNPHKVLCGASLQTLCYRLHITDDVLPLIEKAHIHTAHQLLLKTDEELEKIGIKEEIHGKRVSGIKHAEHLRKVLVALGKDPQSADLTEFEQKCHDDYNLCPSGKKEKSQAVRRVFEESYGERFAARAANFAVGGVLQKPLSALKLARFFSLYETPGLAKEHVSDLLKHDITEHETEFDKKRVEESLDIILYAAETIKVLVKGHPGLYYRMVQTLDLVEGDMLRKKRELRNNPSELQIRNHHKREKLMTERLYLLLLDLKELDGAARTVQGAARGFNAGRIMKLAREKKFVDAVKEDYLFQRNNNHVLDIWKEDRRKEEEEYQRKYQEWLKEEERKRIEFALKDILREGWREEWRENEQENDTGEGYTIYVRELKKRISRREREERGLPIDQTHITEVLEKIDKPIYTYDEWMATLVLQRFGRIYLAKTMVKRIKRERLRKEKEEQEKKKWEELQKQRKQLVTLTFNLDVVKLEDDIWEGFDPSYIKLAEDTWDNTVDEESDEESSQEEDVSTAAGSSIVAKNKSKNKKIEDHKPHYVYDDPHEEKKDAFLLEMESLLDTETAIEIGSVVQARFDGGEIYYGGVVFQVNPTTFISTQGTKTYPKDTFGILYDDGDWEPDVHKDDIRVVKLIEGMKVEARFGGHDAYFPGTVTGTNRRDGKILSYRITYDDGSEEKAVRRSRIKLGDDIIKENDAKLQRLLKEHKALVKRKKELREKQMSKWFRRMDSIDDLLDEYDEVSEVSIFDFDKDDQIKHLTDVYVEDWTPQEYVNKTKGQKFGFKGKSDCADLTKTKVNISKFKELGKKLFDVVRPQVRCTSSLKYTKMPLPYGWREFRHFGNVAGYQNDFTGERRGIADVPTFTFQEDLACRRLQSQWRALEGKREFQKKLTDQSILSVLKLSVEEAKKKCWLGFKQEGMTLEMWLARLGLGQFTEECMERYAKEVRKRGGGRRTSSADGHNHTGRKYSRFGATDEVRRMSRMMISIGEDGVEGGESLGMESIGGTSRKQSLMGSRGRNSVIGSRGRGSVMGGDGGMGSRGRQRGTIMSPGGGRRISSLSPDGGGRRTSSAGGNRRRSSSANSDDSGSRRSSSRPTTVDDHVVGEGGVDTSILTLKIFLRRCESDRWLESMGFTREADRRIIKDMKHGGLQAKQQFKFLNYYKNSSDPRSIRHCVEDSEEALTALVSKRYRNNPKRVHAIVHELCSSHFPITTAQMERFFKKYDGKPAMAQENVRKELVDVKTTSVRSEEKESYDILKSGITRVGVLLNNLGVAELTATLNDAVQAADRVIEEGKMEEKRRDEEKKRLEEEKEKAEEEEREKAIEKERRGSSMPGAARRHSAATERKFSNVGGGLIGVMGGGGARGGGARLMSGHEAKAGLILRRDAIQLVIDWWNSTLLLQKRFRGFKQRKAYRLMQEDRARAATKLQGAMRTFIFVKKLTKYLLSQYNSQIEQLWSDEESAFYWFDKRTQSSVWEEPKEPYRPMIRDKFTQQLMQAWPILDKAIVEEGEAPPGICMICKEEEATRACNQCEQKNSKIKWGDGYLHTCFICFSTFHNETAELRKHTFTVTKKSVAPSLKCCMCGTLATRRCRGMVIPEDVRDKLTTVIVEALDQGGGGQAKEKGVGVLDQIEEEDFVMTVKDILGLGHLFSNERIKSMYAECRGKFKDKRSTAEIWKRFQEHLDAIKDECDENYCADCWESTHSRGKRAKHEWVGFMEGCQVCVECEVLPAEKFCEICEDSYCSNCAKDTHRHGKKHRHPFRGIKEPLEPHQVHCYNCEFRVGTEQCKFCKKMLCNSCNLFEHPSQCPVRIKLTGGAKTDSHEISCAVCGKPPDTVCEQCGDVYCSVKWMGNPGCFRKTHSKGNRKEHRCLPYTFLEDRIKHEEEEQRKAREAHEARVAKMQREKEAREQFERNLMEKAETRKRKLELTAQEEFEKKHTGRLQAVAAKKWSRYLPAIFKGGRAKSSKDMIANMPTVSRMQESLREAKEKHQREEREKLERGKVGGGEGKNDHAPPIENVLVRAKAEEEERQRLRKEKANKAKQKADKAKAKEREADEAEKGSKAVKA